MAYLNTIKYYDTWLSSSITVSKEVQKYLLWDKPSGRMSRSVLKYLRTDKILNIKLRYVRGFPVMYIYTKQKIYKGDQILTDYGDGYWNKRGHLLRY